MMNSPDQSPNMFYLGFNKDTGELEEVIVPEGKTLWLSPKDGKKLKNGKLSGSEKERVEKLKKNYDFKAEEGTTTSRELVFIDISGASVCCGSCGGIPFCWC